MWICVWTFLIHMFYNLVILCLFLPLKYSVRHYVVSCSLFERGTALIAVMFFLENILNSLQLSWPHYHLQFYNQDSVLPNSLLLNYMCRDYHVFGWICLYHLQPLIPEHISPIKMWEMSIKAIDYKAVILYLLPF